MHTFFQIFLCEYLFTDKIKLLLLACTNNILSKIGS